MARLFLTALIPALVSLAPPARAQTPNVATHESTTTARVERIEKSSRVVTVLAEGNVIHSLYVDSSVRAFDDLKVGDKVTVRYVESVVVRLRRGAKLQDVRDTTAEAQKAGNENVIEQLSAVVTIESIDSQKQTVTYRTRDNLKLMRLVQDKTLLDGLRPGDEVEVTLTRERAISIERAR